MSLIIELPVKSVPDGSCLEHLFALLSVPSFTFSGWLNKSFSVHIQEWYHDSCMGMNRNDQIGCWVCVLCRKLPQTVNKIESLLEQVIKTNGDLLDKLTIVSVVNSYCFLQRTDLALVLLVLSTLLAAISFSIVMLSYVLNKTSCIFNIWIIKETGQWVYLFIVYKLL
jgi:hypothetical protein